MIIEESHFYPFGLKHSGYNNTTNFANASTEAQKYKFQEQERQDELGLNWDSFQWRNYDYAIGRFMSIDPLGEKYNWQTNYAFGSNQVIHSRELEGLEAQDDYNDGDDHDWNAGLVGGWVYDNDNLLTFCESCTVKDIPEGLHWYGTTVDANFRDDPSLSGHGDENGVIELQDVTVSVEKGYDRNGQLNGDDANDNKDEGDGENEYEKLFKGIATGADSFSFSISKAKVINALSGGAKIESSTLKAITGTGTVIGAIAGGVPAAMNIFSGKGTTKDYIALGLAGAGVAAEIIGFGEVWDAAIAVGSLGFDIWSASHHN